MEHKTKFLGVRIVKIISESKKWNGSRPRPGHKRVMAIVSIHGKNYTRHGDTKDGEFLIMK